MKRTFLAKRNALLSSTNVSWSAALLGVVVLLFIIRTVFPNIFLHLAAPVLDAGNSLASGMHYFTARFRDAAALQAENDRLSSENAALAAENRALAQKEADMSALGSTGGIVAGVMSRPPESPYDTFTLAAGKKAGIERGMEAFGPGGVPIGIVTDVLNDFSRVALFSSPGMTVSGWVGARKVPITLTGAGAGAFTATLARIAGASVGDSVFVPGPGALPIASVVRIDTDPSSPTIALEIQSTVNLFSITWVSLRPASAAFASAFSWGSSAP